MTSSWPRCWCVYKEQILHRSSGFVISYVSQKFQIDFMSRSQTVTFLLRKQLPLPYNADDVFASAESLFIKW